MFINYQRAKMGTEKEALLEKVLNRWKMFNGSQAHAKTTTSVTSNMLVRRWRAAMDLEINFAYF